MRSSTNGFIDIIYDAFFFFQREETENRYRQSFLLFSVVGGHFLAKLLTRQDKSFSYHRATEKLQN